MDATDSKLCERRVSSSESLYLWSQGLVGASHNTYQQHHAFVSLDDVCHNAIVTEFEAWSTAIPEAFTPPEKFVGTNRVLGSPNSGLHHLSHPCLGRGCEGARGEEGAVRGGVNGARGGADFTRSSRLGQGLCEKVIGGELLVVGDSRMRSLFWHLLALMSRRPVAARINPSRWHVFNAWPGEGRAGEQEDADWWCWPGRFENKVATLAVGGCHSLLSAEQVQEGRRVDVVVEKVVEGWGGARMSVDVCDEGNRMAGPTRLTFVHTPDVAALFSFLRAVSAYWKLGARGVLIWAVPLQELEGFDSGAMAGGSAIELKVESVIARLQYELPLALQQLGESSRIVTETVAPFDLADNRNAYNNLAIARLNNALARILRSSLSTTHVASPRAAARSLKEAVGSRWWGPWAVLDSWEQVMAQALRRRERVGLVRGETEDGVHYGNGVVRLRLLDRLLEILREGVDRKTRPHARKEKESPFNPIAPKSCGGQARAVDMPPTPAYCAPKWMATGRMGWDSSLDGTYEFGGLGCKMRRFSPAEARQCLANRRVLLMGDSVVSHQCMSIRARTCACLHVPLHIFMSAQWRLGVFPCVNLDVAVSMITRTHLFGMYTFHVPLGVAPSLVSRSVGRSIVLSFAFSDFRICLSFHTTVAHACNATQPHDR